MPTLLGPELAVWCELLTVLGIGTSVAVALAALLSRRARSAVWERAIWQACTVTLLAFVALEVTGLGAAAVRLGVASWSEAWRRGKADHTVDMLTPDEIDVLVNDSLFGAVD